MKQKIVKFMRYLRSRLPQRTPPKTIMWIRVPMSVNSKVEKEDLIFETMNHLERTIKIKKNVRIQAQPEQREFI